MSAKTRTVIVRSIDEFGRVEWKKFFDSTTMSGAMRKARAYVRRHVADEFTERVTTISEVRWLDLETK